MLITYFLREVSTVMNIANCGKTMKYAAFEDSNRALEMAKIPKMRPRTKYIVIKYHF